MQAFGRYYHIHWISAELFDENHNINMHILIVGNALNEQYDFEMYKYDYIKADIDKQFSHTNNNKLK